MNDETSTVMTVYVRDNAIDNFSISRLKNEDAVFYCKTINSLKTQDESKVYARIINTNTQYSLDDFIPLNFGNIVSLDDRSIQKVMREVDAQDLAKALKGTSEETQNKIFNNMSNRAVAMLKEDMEYMGPIRIDDVKEAQEKIVNIIKMLEDTGEIKNVTKKGELIV